MVPGRIVNADADEPAEQKVVFQPLHQKPFRADRIESLQQHRPQKLLGRDRRPSDRRVKRRTLSAKCSKRLVHDQSDRSKWMNAPHPIFQIDIAEKFARPDIAATHASTPNLDGTNESWPMTPDQSLFQQPAKLALSAPHLGLVLRGTFRGVSTCKTILTLVH